MNLKEVSQLLAIIKEVYPNYIKDNANIPIITKMWHRQLANYDVKIVTAGLDAFIAKDTKGFAPVPGQLLAEISKIIGHVKQERYLTHMEAWEKVREVMSGAMCYHNPDKAFKSLPEYIQQVVGSAGTLVKWSMMDIERLETVIIPKSFSKGKRLAAEHNIIRPTTKPDLDNLLKNVKDCLTAMRFWEDDKLVVGFLPGTGKYYSDRPRWEIEIKQLGN